MLVCLCRAVREHDVERAIQKGARSAREVSKACGAGTSCGACVPMVREMIQRAQTEAPSSAGTGEACQASRENAG
ncbi:MAG: (2Fe-2S)-binding protein [Deltaproteobacteria bacterium]|nr:(2Fe-2S)-binding protein [Deltaproteobacteria bacterium]